MRKKIITLASLFVVLAILGGAYYYVAFVKDKNETVDSTESETTSEKYDLVKHDTADLKELNVSRDDWSFTIIPDESSEEPNWVFKDINITERVSAVTDIVNMVCDVNSTKRIMEKAENLEEYGLNPPKATATVVFNDKTEKIYIGNLTVTNDFYYFMVEGNEGLYLMAKFTGDKYFKTMSDFVYKTLPTIDIAKLTKVVVKFKDKKTFEAVAETTMTEADAAMAEYGYVGLKTISPITGHTLYVDSLSKDVIEPLASMKIGDLVALEVTEENIKEFGFDNPRMYMEYGGEGYDYRITIGNNADELGETVYIAFGGPGPDLSDFGHVFTTESALIAKLEQIDFLAMVERFVALINIMDTESVDVVTPNESHHFDLNHKFEKAATEEDKDKEWMEPVVDGQSVQEAAIKKLYQIIIGISYEVLYDEIKVEGTPDMTITFNLKDGSKVTNHYKVFNDNFYSIIDEDGNSMGAVNKRYISEILEGFTSVKEGKFDKK